MYESKCSMVDTGLPRSPSSVGTTNRSYNLDAAKERARDGLNGGKSCGEGRGKAWPMENPLKTEKGGKARRRIRCGTLCLWLPRLLGYGKGKGRNRKEETETEAEGGGCISISISISRRVSLETFECGSWTSSGTGSLYFDLPMELIRNSVGAQSQSQPQSPVKAAFVFDRDGKGVHLPVWTKPKLVEESFSPSPCTITPRLCKARQEFNTLLEAHVL